MSNISLDSKILFIYVKSEMCVFKKFRKFKPTKNKQLDSVYSSCSIH